MTIHLSGRPSENELRALELLLPPQMGLRLEEGGAVLLTLYSLSPEKKELVTFEISLCEKDDFSGPLLADFLEEWTSMMVCLHDELRDSSDCMENKILKIIDESLDQAKGRYLSGNEFRVRVQKIHTTDEYDWY